LRTKKADVLEHPRVFQHVGLLMNEPTGKSSLLLISSSELVPLFWAKPDSIRGRDLVTDGTSFLLRMKHGNQQQGVFRRCYSDRTAILTGFGA